MPRRGRRKSARKDIHVSDNEMEMVEEEPIEDVEEDAYRAVLEEVFTWLNRMPTDAVGFAGTLKADRTHTNLITTYSKRCYVPLRLSSSNGVASLQTNKRKNS